MKEIIKTLKEGKIKANANLIVMVAATAALLESQKLENQTEASTKIVHTYIELHGSAATSNPTPAAGIYEISTTSFSGGTGGGVFTSSTSYYDISTRQFLGEVH
jgi:hypothetical protein